MKRNETQQRLGEDASPYPLPSDAKGRASRPRRAGRESGFSSSQLSSLDNQLLKDAADAVELTRNLATLCDGIGSRFAGTAGYRRAADFVLERFRAYRLENACLEPFAFTAWRRGAPASLAMLKPDRRDYDCYALPYCAATGEHGITAGIVDIGDGGVAAVEANRRRIQGRFILTDGAAGHRTVLYERCSALGARGFILSNPKPGMMLHTGTVADGKGGAIPAVSVAYESARQIQRLAADAKDALRLRLVVNATLEADTTWNVLGELRGSEHPDELVIIGGHLDSHEIGPGAYDNGAGVLMVMEVARLLARQRRYLKRTVRFIAFAAEEIGLLGSHYHAKAHAAELQKARFMLNCDTPLIGKPHGLGFHECPKGEACLAKLSEAMGEPIRYQNRHHCHSDHYPFILQRVPTAGVAGGNVEPPVQHYMHMAADTVDKIRVDALQDTAAFAARALLHIANDEQWPNMQRSKAEVARWKRENR